MISYRRSRARSVSFVDESPVETSETKALSLLPRLLPEKLIPKTAPEGARTIMSDPAVEINGKTSIRVHRRMSVPIFSAMSRRRIAVSRASSMSPRPVFLELTLPRARPPPAHAQVSPWRTRRMMPHTCASQYPWEFFDMSTLEVSIPLELSAWTMRSLIDAILIQSLSLVGEIFLSHVPDCCQPRATRSISRALATLRWSRSRVGSPASTLTGSSSLST